MRRAHVSRRWQDLGSILFLAMLALFVAGTPARAQANTVSGVITDSLTRRPVSDALISAAGTSLSARTNLRGEFTLAGLTGTTVSLTIARIGYQRITQSVAVGATNLS